MNQDNTMHDYTQLMRDRVWNKEVVCGPESVISFLNDSGEFQSFGGGLIWAITQKMPNLAGCTPKAFRVVLGSISLYRYILAHAAKTLSFQGFVGKRRYESTQENTE